MREVLEEKNTKSKLAFSIEWRAQVLKYIHFSYLFRHSKFSLQDQQLIRALLFLMVHEDRTRKIQAYVHELNQRGYHCQREYVRQIFVDWRWSWKTPKYIQLNKYQAANVAKYSGFVKWIVAQDLKKVKFTDEVHFVAKGR